MGQFYSAVYRLVTLMEKKGEILTFHAEADETYYVKFEITNKLSLKHFNVCKAELQKEEIALPEINKCKKTKDPGMLPKNCTT